MTRLFVSLSALAMIWAALPADAAADRRKGFVAGFGVGPGFASIAPAEGERVNEPGVATDITLGYAFTDQLAVYAMSKIVWFDLNGDLTFSEVAGVGVTYFFSEAAKSPYVVVGGGYSVFVQPAADTIDNQFGVGVLVGAGYEFADNWVVQADAGWNNPGDFQTQLVMVKLGYLHY